MRPENKGVFIDAATLRGVPTVDLQIALKETEDSLFALENQAAVIGSRMKPDYAKPHLRKGYKKQIARIKTILREREINRSLKIA